MQLLISVRTAEEALLAARAGADFIDLKEPRLGALGGLPLETIRAIVAALRGSEPGVAEPATAPGAGVAATAGAAARAAFSATRSPKRGSNFIPTIGPTISATIGDLPMSAIDDIMARVAAVAACGADLVKVGIVPGPGADRVLQALAEGRKAGVPVVPLFVADGGLQGALFDALLDRALAQRFFAVMVDTADKSAGSLLDLVPLTQLEQFVARARAAGLRVGLAGALRQAHLPALARLQPSFVGFRGAVCEQTDRSGELSGPRVVALREALQVARRAVVARLAGGLVDAGFPIAGPTAGVSLSG